MVEEAFLVGIRGKHLRLLVHGKDQPSERLGQLNLEYVLCVGYDEFVFGVKGVTCVCSIRNATFGFTAKRIRVGAPRTQSQIDFQESVG